MVTIHGHEFDVRIVASASDSGKRRNRQLLGWIVRIHHSVCILLNVTALGSCCRFSNENGIVDSQFRHLAVPGEARSMVIRDLLHGEEM